MSRKKIMPKEPEATGFLGSGWSRSLQAGDGQAADCLRGDVPGNPDLYCGVFSGNREGCA